MLERIKREMKKISPKEIFKERIYKTAEEIEKGNYDVIFFLDRSARTIYSALCYVWQTKYKGKKIPEIRFLNIGREQTLKTLQQEDRKILDSIKSSIIGKVGKQTGLRLLIIDDVYENGNTMVKASGLINQVFQGAEIEGLTIFNADSIKSEFQINWIKIILGSFFRNGNGVETKNGSVISVPGDLDRYKRLKAKIKSIFEE